MNERLFSSYYAGRRAPVGDGVALFDRAGRCLGLVQKDGVKHETPQPIGQSQLDHARRFPRYFRVLEEGEASASAAASSDEPLEVEGKAVVDGFVTDEEKGAAVLSVAGEPVAGEPSAAPETEVAPETEETPKSRTSRRKTSG